MIEHAIAAFVQEARDILTELEDQLLQLENGAEPALIDAIFRGLHTVKGSGAMFGYTALARFTHHFENAYDRVRAGTLPVNKDLIDLSFEAADTMSAFLDLGGDGAEAEALLENAGTADVISRIQALAGAEGTPSTPATEHAQPEETAPAETTQWQVTFRPPEDALRNGMRPDLLINEVEDLGPSTTVYDTSGLPALIDMDPTASYLGYEIIVETAANQSDFDEVFLFAEEAEPVIIPMPTVSAEAAEADAASQSSGAQAAAPAKKRSDETIRIAADRLDAMMDAIGELVIAQARLDAVSETLGDGTLDNVAEQMGRLVLGLRDTTLSVRMLPIETVFGKFRRVVRDLSSELGKDVRLETSGGDTELDKTVIDKLGDPLVHMIRNSVDHGVEPADAREQAGKPEQAVLHLSARQEGGEILVTLADDGRGLDADAIKARAIERGLLEPDADPGVHALHQMIFEPGFSTAKAISAVSGRGVGMDAVRSTIDALGGGVDVESTPGVGTRITLRLPVTMAIVDGLRVRLGENVFVIPLSAVEECVEMQADAAARQSGRTVLEIRQRMVPYLALETLFNLGTTPENDRRVVVVRVDGRRVGLVVDDILGRGQTVIKSLSPYHRDIPGLGGATILGDGRVALILDVLTLVRWAEARVSPRRVA